MTKPKFAGKMIIILAGYENDMNKLLGTNEGLNSRFADEIIFPALSPKDSLLVLQNGLKKEHGILIDGMKDISTHEPFLEMIKRLSTLPAWGNARDMITLAKGMIHAAYQSTLIQTANSTSMVLPYDEATACIQHMINSKNDRAKIHGQPRYKSSTMDQVMDMTQEPPTPTSIATATAAAAKAKTRDMEETPPIPLLKSEIIHGEESRDAGVSDEIWTQLQRDKNCAEKETQRYAEEMRKYQKEIEALQEAETIAREQIIREIKEKDAAEQQAKLLLRGEARLRELRARAEKDRIEKEMERKRLREEEKREKDKKAQEKLRTMGVCVAGFRWIKQGGGYRCAGGSHFVSDGQLGM